MKFLSTPLAALSASFLTWYYLGQQELQMPPETTRSSEIANQLASDGVPAEIVGRLREVLEEKERQISNLEEAAEAAKATGDGPRMVATDPFKDLLDAAVRSIGVMQDVASYSANAVAPQMCSWLAARKEAIPLAALRPLMESAENAFKHHLGHLGPVVEKAGAITRDLLGKVPLEVTETAKDFSQRIASAMEIAVQGFLEQYPQYRTSVVSTHPGFLLVLLIVLVYFTVWEIYGFWRLLLSFACKLLSAVQCILCCGCCRRETLAGSPHRMSK